MKKFRWLPVFGMTAVTLALAGCGSGSTSDVSVRIANATLTHPSIDLLVNGASAITGDTTDTVSAYSSPASGSVAIQVNDTTTGTALSASVPTLTGGDHYTVVAYESSGVVKTAILTEDTVLPAAGVTTLRIYDAAIEAGKVDVYIASAASTALPLPCGSTSLGTIAPVTSFGLLTAPAAVAITQGSGNWTVCVTGSGSKTDLRMTLPITLTSATVATIMMTPASGGTLMNGSLVVQQAGYTAARNTNTRVRLAAAMPNGAVVAASSSSGVVIDAGSASPALDFSYALVPSADSLNVTVAGASVAAPATALPVGGDVTLLVYPISGLATATLLTDDNRLPTDQTTVKLRLINGVTSTGAVGNLTLTANNSPVGINVAPGTASAYNAVPGSVNPMAFVLTSSASSGQLPLANASQTLNPATTYTILAGGDLTAPQMLIR